MPELADRANPAAAYDYEVAQRRGSIYLKNRAWHCTTSGNPLTRDGVHLYCKHCGVTILSPGDPT